MGPRFRLPWKMGRENVLDIPARAVHTNLQRLGPRLSVKDRLRYFIHKFEFLQRWKVRKVAWFLTQVTFDAMVSTNQYNWNLKRALSIDVLHKYCISASPNLERWRCSGILGPSVVPRGETILRPSPNPTHNSYLFSKTYNYTVSQKKGPPVNSL